MILTGCIVTLLISATVLALAWTNWWSGTPDRYNTVALFAAVALVLMLEIDACTALIGWFIRIADSPVWSYTVSILYIVAVNALGWQFGAELRHRKLARIAA